MTRNQQYAAEVKAISRQFIRANMPDAKMLTVDICFDLPNEFYRWAWDTTKVASGLQKDFIAKSGFEPCKKADATLLMVIGEKNEDTDAWVSGKFKNYWLRPKS